MLRRVNVWGRGALDFNCKIWPELDLHPQATVTSVSFWSLKTLALTYIHFCQVAGNTVYLYPIWQVTPLCSETTCPGQLYPAGSELLTHTN